MKKEPFVTKEQIEEIVKSYPTPFHLYDEKGIRENAKAVKEAFAWNPGFREYFAVKATPNPFLLNILREYGCGADCSSMTELMLSHEIGMSGEEIMFSSNDTPAEEFVYANEIGATINLDDFTHIDFLEKAIGKFPKTMSLRYNPGGVYTLSNGIMDNPGDAKYGFTKEQLFEGYKLLKEKGVERFGIHAFLVSNTVTNDYYPTLARTLFELCVEIKENLVSRSVLSICPAVLESLTNRIRFQMISVSSAQAFRKYMRKFLFRQIWVTLPFIPRWEDS